MPPLDLDRVIENLRRRAAIPTNALTTPIGTDLLVMLLDELAEARRTLQWQPIETAPKDGTLIITTRYKGAMRRPVAAYWGNDYSTSGDFAWTDGEYTYCPSHWMPLPAPPED